MLLSSYFSLWPSEAASGRTENTSSQAPCPPQKAHSDGCMDTPHAVGSSDYAGKSQAAASPKSGSSKDERRSETFQNGTFSSRGASGDGVPFGGQERPQTPSERRDAAFPGKRWRWPWVGKSKESVRAPQASKMAAGSFSKASFSKTTGAFASYGRPVALGSLWSGSSMEADYTTLAQQGYEQNVIVYRAVSLVARSLAMVPWTLEAEQGSQQPLPPAFEHLFAAYGSRYAFMERITAHLLLSGNCYIYAVQEDATAPPQLWILRPDRIHIKPISKGEGCTYTYTVDGTSTVITPDAQGFSPLLHIKYFHPTADWEGLSPLAPARQAIAQHNTVTQHNLSLLQNGGRPSGALIYKGAGNQALDETTRQLLREDLQEFHRGSQQAGRLMLLEGDMDWREMGLRPKDLDYVEGKLLSAREIAQVFGVPPMLVGVPGDATYANYREARFHLWEDTVLPLLDRIMASLNPWLRPLLGASERLSYTLEDIPAMAYRRETVWQRVEAASFLTVNEKRQALGYPPLPDKEKGGADVPTQKPSV